MFIRGLPHRILIERVEGEEIVIINSGKQINHLLFLLFMRNKIVKKYLLIYNLATIVTVYLITLFDFSYYDILTFMGYLLFLFYISPLLSMIVFVVLTKFVLKDHEIRPSPIWLDDFYLSASVIITTFLVPDLIKIIENPVIVAILIIPLFFLIYWTNEKLGLLEKIAGG